MGVEQLQWFHMEVAAPRPESFIHQFFRKLSSWVREAVGLSGDDDDFVEEEYPFAVIYTFPHHPYRLKSSQNPLHLEIPQQTKNKALAHGIWIAGAVGVLLVLGFLLSQYNLRNSLGEPIGEACSTFGHLGSCSELKKLTKKILIEILTSILEKVKADDA